MRPPRFSGHCRFPETPHPIRSHERCQRMGHGNSANPDHEFSPCPCKCHLGEDPYECGNCGMPLREAPHWPNEDEPGEMVYVHVDEDGNALGEECEHLRRAVEPEPEPEEDEPFLDEDEAVEDDEDEDEDDLWDLLDEED